MNTIKFYLATSGRVADMHKDFPLFQNQFQNKLINVYVPTSILAPQYSAQYYIGQFSASEMPTDSELTLFVKNNTATGRNPINGDVIEFTYLGEVPNTYWLYIYNNNAWTSQQVDSLGTTNALDGTSVQIGMLANRRNGVIYESKKYFMRYLKTLTYQNVEYAMYERKMPKEFTKFVGQNENAPIIIFNVVNLDLEEKVITKVITSQSCNLDVMPSDELDQDPDIEQPSELERISALVDTLNAQMQTKQDKVDDSINTGAIVTTKNLVGAINDLSSNAETNTNNISDLQAEVALKQDKTDANLETTDKTVVGAINELNTQVGINTTNIGYNTSDISAVSSRVTTLEGIVGSGEDYIGTYTATYDPATQFEALSTALTAYVKSVRGESYNVQGGDVVIYTQTIEHGTDKNYKFIFSGSTNEWTYYELPAMEYAQNDTYGIVKGTYSEESTDNTQVDITDGEIKGVYVVDSSSTKRNIREYLNTDSGRITTNTNNISTNTGNIAQNTLDIQANGNAIGTLNTNYGKIVDGTTAVGYAKQAEKDSLNRNIAETYLTQNLGATKQQLYDYALPRTFNDVSFVGADNEFVDVVPDSETALYTTTSTLVGETELFYVEKTIDNAYFELANKNSYNDTLYVSASADCTVTFKVTTQVYHNAQWTTINTELTEPVTFESGVIRRVEFGSTMNSLTDILNIIPEDKIKQTFEVVTTTSTSITFSVYSNETYPSAFYLNTTSQVIIVAQGALGEMPVYLLTGTSVEGDIVFTIPSEREFNSNVNSLYQLSYSGVVQDNTNIKLEQNGISIRLETPYNYGSLDDAKVADLTQVSVVDTEQLHTWLFTAVTKESGGEKYLVVSEDNLTDLSNIVAGKQDQLPTTTTAGRVLKSTSTANTTEWGTLSASDVGAVASNTAITGATKTKITYDSKGLVTAGGDLEASDIPNISLSKISDVTASASELNVLDGITASTSELNILDGVTATTSEINVLDGITATTTELNYVDGVTSSIQTQLDGKQATLTTAQQNAVDSGIDSTNVGQIATNTTDISTINGKIPTQASTSNQLADKDFVNSSINAFASYYITKNAQGDPFATKAELTGASTFYSGGVARIPTTNDYAIVLADESKTSGGVDPSTRYTYQGGTYPSGQWEYQYTINVTPLTSAQLQALNSGITSSLVTQIGTNQSDISTLNTTKLNNVSYDTTNKKLQKTIGSTTTDIVSTSTLKADMGLATVATSGSYDDLSNKPTIPTVNDATLTIQKNSTNVGTFTANSSSDTTIDISVPTSDSDLTNNRYVRFDTNAQDLTDTEKANARANIGAGSARATTVLVNDVAQSSISFDSDPQTQITSLENNKQDTLTAGNGISLVSNTISWNNTISAELDTTGTTSCYVKIKGASGQEFPRPIKLFVQVRYSASGGDKPLVDTYIISTESTASGSVQILSNKYTSGFYRSNDNDSAILIQFSNYTSSQRPTNIYISALSPYDVSTLTITKTNGTPSNTPVNVFAITNISKEFFDVVYNITSYYDIDTAYNSGKLLICRKTDGTEYFGVYGLIGLVGGIPQYGYIFNSITAINAPKLTISGFTVNSSNVWTTFSNTLGTASSKDTGTTDGTIPVLGTDGKLPSSVIPASAITDTFVVNSQNAMLALSSAKIGDVCVRTDINKSFILKQEPYSTLTNWQELLTPTDAVISVNSQTGAVVLSASDVSALPSSTKYGASLSVSGTSVQLKDQDGNNLGSAITTQDTTYSLASTTANGLLRQLNSSSVSTQTQSTKFLREDGTWQAPSYTPTTSSVTSGSTSALTSGGAYTNLVSDVTYDSTNKKLKKTKGGSTTDLVTFGANAFNSTTIPTSYVSSVNGSTGAVTVAKTDLSNVTYPSNTEGSTKTGSGDRVIETYISTVSSGFYKWYRKWESGWKECGGYSDPPSNNTWNNGWQINFGITFTKAPTVITTIHRNADNGDASMYGNVMNISTTYFTTQTYRNGTTAGQLYWYACGW